MLMIFQLSTRTIQPDVMAIELAGRMASGNLLMKAEEDIKRLLATEPSKVIFDLTRLEYIDSAAIGVLVMAVGLISKRYGGQVRLAGANERVSRILQITHLDRVLSMHNNMENACASFERAAAESA